MKLNLVIMFVVILILAQFSYSMSKKIGRKRGKHALFEKHRHRGKGHRHIILKKKYQEAVHVQAERRSVLPQPTPMPKHIKHILEKSDKARLSNHETSGEMFLHSASTPASTNSVLDVGLVTVVSVSQSCNGVLLDPSVVLTSASCVSPNYISKTYEEINFILNGVKKVVKKVFQSEEWRRTGERKSDFALLLLAQPMTNIQAQDLTSLTWSPYALEDIGESFIAMPSPASCQTASKKAKSTDTIRHAGDKIITVSCSNAGMALAGSPFYRRVDTRSIIYGVYFGQCTSGSLDRKMTGLCGARITKHVFEDFCEKAKNENIDLPDCSSKLLTSLNDISPTEISSNVSYDAVSSTADNLKGAVIVYHNSAIPNYKELVLDIDSIQRNKIVYDKFQMAIVDVKLVPFDLSYSPYIEFRTAGAKTYLPYNDEYKFKQFKRFMSDFSRVGAPPAGSTSFIQHLHVVNKRSATGKKRKAPHSEGIEGGKKMKQLVCDDKGTEVVGKTHECICVEGYIGSGTPGNCQDRLQAIKEHCRFDVESDTSTTSGQTYDQIQTLSGQATWCSKQMFVFSYLNGEVESVDVSGKDLITDDCEEEIEEMVTCEEEDFRMAYHLSKHYDSHINRNHRNDTSSSYKRTDYPATTKPLPVDYQKNYLDDQPPPITYSPRSHFIYQDWVPSAQSSFSTVHDGLRGIAEYTGYKLISAQLLALKNKNTIKRKLISNGWHFDKDLPSSELQGKTSLYAGRGNKKNRDAVDKGHLNPSLINSFDAKTMKLTHTYTNAYPQYSYFNIGTWKKYEKKIFDYAKSDCQGKDATAELYLLTGLSDYKIIGPGQTNGVGMPDFWPSKGAKPAIPKNAKPIVMAKSMWTVGCCSWTVRKKMKGEAVSIWANNEQKGISNQPQQLDLAALAKLLYPSAKSGFKFFPGNAECETNHHTL